MDFYFQKKPNVLIHLTGKIQARTLFWFDSAYKNLVLLQKRKGYISRPKRQQSILLHSYWDFADRSCLSSKFCSLTKKWCRTFWGFCSTNFSIFSKNRCAILLENFKIGLAKIPQNVLHHSFCQTTKFLAEKTSGQLNIVATQQNLISQYCLLWEQSNDSV